MILGITCDADAKRGFYLGLGVPYNTIDGDFNGKSDLQQGDEVIIVPRIDPSFGLDIFFGYGISQKWAVELNFLGSTHGGKWGRFSGNVDYFSFSINGKYIFASTTESESYLLFGSSDNVLIIRDGSQNLSTGETGDAILSGSGLNLGVGIDEYLSRHMSLGLRMMFRVVNYTNAEGVKQSGTIEDGLDGSGLSLMLSATHHF